jgi:hypothetical protein
MVLAATMATVGGVGLGLGLDIWWPIILAAVFVAALSAIALWR